MDNKDEKKQIKLLDCTLRDGGSVNNWNFGRDNIIHIMQSLNDAGIDVVEIGFLQDGYSKSNDLSISDNTKSFDEKLINIVDRTFKAVAMIDIGKFNIKKLPEKSATLIDGIRLMFKKHQIDLAIEYSNIIKDKGYSLSLNPVSVTTYSGFDIEKLCDSASKIMPDILYIIDTYGLMDNNDTKKYLDIFDKYLNDEIEIGYHSHNNLQLAFSNSIAVIDTQINRNIVIDGSLYGMGKRAGNTPTELLANYLNVNYSHKYDINTLNNIIETVIMPMHLHYDWGYSLIHYIAAINKCHSDYVSYLYKERKVNFSKINQILKLIPENKKLIFDKSWIDSYGKV